MHDVCILTAEAVFYPETQGFGYKIYARNLGKAFLVVASPGSFVKRRDALEAAKRDVRALQKRLQVRDARFGIYYHNAMEDSA